MTRGGIGALVIALPLALGAPAGAAPLELTGHLEQGGLIRGMTEPGASLILDDRAVPVSPDGHFVFGFGRDAPETARLVLHLPDGSSEERVLTIEKRQYVIQRIEGLPQETVTPSPEQLARIEREAAQIRALREVVSAEPDAFGTLIWPAIGPISGVYGSQRILNGEKRAPHLGVDVAAPAGTPVVAAQGGIVRLTEAFFLTGNTVMIDHGYGLTTTYLHLSRIDVKPGQHVRQGETIGAIGATGRVTAAHLHWGMEWFGVRLDPQLAVGPMPAQ